MTRTALVTTSRRKRWVMGGVIAAIVGAGIVVYRHYTADIPFSSAAWKSAGTRGSLRYRMSRDLVQRLGRERWTIDEVFDQLGPAEGFVRNPDDPGWELWKRRLVRYPLGSTPVIGFPYDLTINFGEDLRVAEAEAQPH